MKKSRIRLLLFVLLALVLIGVGMILTLQTFAHFEQLAVEHRSHEQLMRSLKITGFYTMLLGGIVVVGIGILVICFLHVMRRTARLRKEAEALRQKHEALESLAHHQRLETIGTLTSSIAHEFNNLLTPIMGYSLMALEKLPPEAEELYDDILEIYNASRKAKDIISRLSDLSRKNTSLTFRAASPDDLVRRTLDVANPAKPRNVEIRMNLNCWDQRIRANEIQIHQLLLNLVLNSFHAMEETGGMLTVDTAFDEKNIRIRVEDTGCGIEKDVLPKIFEPFFTTKEAGKGTGLGLAIAAQVVEDHRGKIQAESRVGEGTVFTVTLPRHLEEEP